MIGLFATLRALRHGGLRHARHGCGPAGFGGWGRGRFDDDDYEPRVPRRGWRGRRGGMLRGLFARLDTSPGQEKAILGLLEQARGIARDQRSTLRDARGELAAVFASDVLDRDALTDSLVAPRRVLDSLQDDFVTLIAGLHELLDTHQRRVVGRMIADGPLGRGSRFDREYD